MLHLTIGAPLDGGAALHESEPDTASHAPTADLTRVGHVPQGLGLRVRHVTCNASVSCASKRTSVWKHGKLRRLASGTVVHTCAHCVSCWSPQSLPGNAPRSRLLILRQEFPDVLLASLLLLMCVFRGRGK